MFNRNPLYSILYLYRTSSVLVSEGNRWKQGRNDGIMVTMTISNGIMVTKAIFKYVPY